MERWSIGVMEYWLERITPSLHQVAENSASCFEILSMNGILPIISDLFPFVPSPSKDSEKFFSNPPNTPISG